MTILVFGIWLPCRNDVIQIKTRAAQNKLIKHFLCFGIGRKITASFTDHAAGGIPMGTTSSKPVVSKSSLSSASRATSAFEQGQELLLQARAEAKLEHWSTADDLYKQAVSSLEKAKKQAENQSLVNNVLAQAYLEWGDLYRELKKSLHARSYYQKAQALGAIDAQARLKLLGISSQIPSSAADVPIIGAKEDTDFLTPGKGGTYPFIFSINPPDSTPFTTTDHEAKEKAAFKDKKEFKEKKNPKPPQSLHIN